VVDSDLMRIQQLREEETRRETDQVSGEQCSPHQPAAPLDHRGLPPAFENAQRLLAEPGGRLAVKA
jgi:hypothetical protein